MPWCEPCARYFAPSAVNEDGSCPKCGDLIEAQPQIPVRGGLKLKELANDSGDEKAPWHFKLLVTGLILYLGWRVVSLFL
jgi:hypothetical protein